MEDVVSGVVLVLIIIASLAWMLGLGSTPSAGRGLSYVERREIRENREPLPRTPPEDYKDRNSEPPYR